MLEWLNQLPNVVGFMSGMAQMIIYFIYMNANTNQDMEAILAATLNSDVELVDKKSISERPTEVREHPVSDPGKSEAQSYDEQYK